MQVENLNNESNEMENSVNSIDGKKNTGLASKFKKMKEDAVEILPDLEVLFAVRKSKNEFYSREKIRRALDDKKLAAELGLRVVGVQV